ncbi:MAG TPA: GNAT family N-acetyltransferase [Caldimonas sp.]|jgi:putative acetyltransferase
MTIAIRRARIDDAAAIARLMDDPAVYPGLMQMPYVSEEAQRARLADGLVPGKADVLLVAERAGEIVGSSGLHPTGSSPRRRHAMVIGLSVRADAQGQGVGSALMQAMCDYADRWIGLLRLELTVYVDNERAVGLYRKFGFEIEGRHRGYVLRDGAFVDAFAMARMHPAPPAIAPSSGNAPL